MCPMVLELLGFNRKMLAIACDILLVVFRTPLQYNKNLSFKLDHQRRLDN